MSSYRYDNFEFSTEPGHPFQAVMWINDNEGQENDYSIKVDSTLFESDRKVMVKEGNFRGRNTYGGHEFTLKYAFFQVGKGSEHPTVGELYYVISSNDKWNSQLNGGITTSFGDDNVENSNSVTIPKDSKNVFFGYTLLAKTNG